MSLQMLIAARVRLNHALPVPMTLTGTLPGATVGTAYSGTLTLAGDFVAPVAITGLAAWMSAGVAGTTVAITGTPMTAETETMTVTATDSSTTPQVATSTQSVVVSEAVQPGGIAYISTVVSTTYGHGDVTVAIPAAAVAGDTMVVLVDSATGGTSDPTRVSIDVAWDADIYGASPILGGSKRSYGFLHYLTSADVTASTIVVHSSSSDQTLHALFMSGHATVTAFSHEPHDDNPAPATISAPSISAAAGDLVLFHAAAYAYGVKTAPTFSIPTGYTLAAGPQSPTYVYALTAYQPKTVTGTVPSAATVTNFAVTADTGGMLIALRAAA